MPSLSRESTKVEREKGHPPGQTVAVSLIVCVQSIRTLPPRRAAEAPGVDIFECGARKVAAEAGVEVESGVAAVKEHNLKEQHRLLCLQPVCLSVTEACTEEAVPIFFCVCWYEIKLAKK